MRERKNVCEGMACPTARRANRHRRFKTKDCRVERDTKVETYRIRESDTNEDRWIEKRFIN